MDCSMQPKLFELSAMLNHQLPILVSFVFLRLVGVFAIGKASNVLTPKAVRPYVSRTLQLVVHARKMLIVGGLGGLAYHTLFNPPASVCQEYDAVQAQGASALLSLAVILSTNHVLASAIALGALRAVAKASASSIVFSTSAAVLSTANGSTALFVYVLFWVASLHAGACHDDKAPTQTHGSIITALAIIFNVLFYATTFFWNRCMRVLQNLIRRSAQAVRRVAHRHEE